MEGVDTSKIYKLRKLKGRKTWKGVSKKPTWQLARRCSSFRKLVRYTTLSAWLKYPGNGKWLYVHCTVRYKYRSESICSEGRTWVRRASRTSATLEAEAVSPTKDYALRRGQFLLQVLLEAISRSFQSWLELFHLPPRISQLAVQRTPSAAPRWTWCSRPVQNCERNCKPC